MNADGSGVTRLTNDAARDTYSSWSPDGTRIAFEARRDGNSEIYVMNADGSDQVNITNNPAGDDQPSWGLEAASPPPTPGTTEELSSVEEELVGLWGRRQAPTQRCRPTVIAGSCRWVDRDDGISFYMIFSADRTGCRWERPDGRGSRNFSFFLTGK
jgi:hypothetical protein